MTAAIQSGTPLAKEAMTDVLKVLFNILLHYPKVCTAFFFRWLLRLIPSTVVDSSRSSGHRTR